MFAKYFAECLVYSAAESMYLSHRMELQLHKPVGIVYSSQGANNSPLLFIRSLVRFVGPLLEDSVPLGVCERRSFRERV